MTNIPTGTVTFLFTDIQGSTKLAQEYPGDWERLRERHHAILHQAIEAHQGYVFRIVGDEFCTAFHTAAEALKAALMAQQILQSENWQPAPVKVRMGINTGAAEAREVEVASDVYTGYTTLARAQRVMSVGHGGQILLSSASAELTRGELPANTSLRDMGEHRLKGLLNLEHLWQVEAPGLASDFPPLQTLNAIPNNLPAQLTSFIGREKEIAEVKDVLTAHRLVTLVGPGGTGKSRLCLQIAAEVLDAFPQGVWFIELAALADPELVPQTILTALGGSEQKGKTMLQSLVEYLQPRRLLLVLDNCEHLIEACAKTAQALLNSAPGVKILASSRESLGVGGEVAWHVPSLSLPNPKNLPELDQMTQYEAVRLFIDRVQLVLPHFSLNQENAPAIAQVCYRLDGIPLAIELAAARAKSMSIEQIMTRLDDRFRLLTGGSRTALPRQQTLRAMIDWSYDLLTETEKLLLRRLAVFADGWTLELAEQICADEKLDTFDILDLLSHLVDKSLVAIEEQQGEMRYRILETIRQYAREKLFESGEGVELRNRHCAAFLDLVERAEPELHKDSVKKWTRIMDAELENIRSAQWWSLENKNASQSMRMCLALDLYWNARSLNREGANYCQEALTLVEQDKALCQTPGYPLLLALAQIHAIQISLNLLTDPASLEALEKATTLLASFNFPKKSFRSFWELSELYLTRNDTEGAEKIMLKSLEGSRQAGDEEGVAWSLSALAHIYFETGQVEKSYGMRVQAREMFQKIGDRVHTLDHAAELSARDFRLGNLKTAQREYEAHLRASQELELDAFSENYLTILGVLASLQGDYELAAKNIREVEIYAKKSGDQTWKKFDILLRKGDLAYDMGEVENACQYFEAALESLKENQSDEFSGHTLKRYGRALLRAGRVEEARQHFEKSIAQMEKVGQGYNTELAWYGLGELERLAGNLPLATRHYQRALFLRNRYQGYVYTPELFDGFAKLSLLQNDPTQSARWFGFADGLRTRFGTVIQPVERPDHDQQLELLKSRMSAKEFSQAWAEAEKMSREDAIALALQGFEP